MGTQVAAPVARIATPRPPGYVLARRVQSRRRAFFTKMTPTPSAELLPDVGQVPSSTRLPCQRVPPRRHAVGTLHPRRGSYTIRCKFRMRRARRWRVTVSYIFAGRRTPARRRRSPVPTMVGPERNSGSGAYPPPTPNEICGRLQSRARGLTRPFDHSRH